MCFCVNVYVCVCVHAKVSFYPMQLISSWILMHWDAVTVFSRTCNVRPSLSRNEFRPTYITEIPKFICAVSLICSSAQHIFLKVFSSFICTKCFDSSIFYVPCTLILQYSMFYALWFFNIICAMYFGDSSILYELWTDYSMFRAPCTLILQYSMSYVLWFFSTSYAIYFQSSIFCRWILQYFMCYIRILSIFNIFFLFIL